MSTPVQKLTKEAWRSKEPCSKELFFEIVKGISKTWDRTGSIGTLISMVARRKNGISVMGGQDEQDMIAAGCSTAYTDFRSIVLLENFLNKLTPMGALFTLLHEGCHMALLHNARIQGREPELWNIAADTLINYIVTAKLLPALTGIDRVTGDMLFVPGVDPMIIGFTETTGPWIAERPEGKQREELLNIFDENNRRMSEEAWYTVLEDDRRERRKQQQPQQGMPQQGKGQGQGGGGGGGGMPHHGQSQGGQPGQGQMPGMPGKDPGQGQGQPGQGGGIPQPGADELLDQHGVHKDLRKKLEEKGRKDLADRLGLPSDDEDMKNRERREINQTKEMIRHALSQSRRLRANGKPSIGGHVDDYVSEAIEKDDNNMNGAKVNWEVFASNIIESACRGEWGEDRLNCDDLSVASRDPLLQQEMGLGGEFFRYGYERKSGKAKVLIIMDTSGSVSKEELQQFRHELKGLVNSSSRAGSSAAYMELTLVFADTESRKAEVLEIRDENDIPDILHIGGRGGTDMLMPLAQEILRTDVSEPYNLAIVFSDGGFPAFDFEDLSKAIAAVDESKITNIPPLAIVNSRPFYASTELDKAMESFQKEGKGGVSFNLREIDYGDVEVTVNEEGFSM